MVTKQITQEDLDAILDEFAEREAFEASVGDQISEAIALAFNSVAAEMAAGPLDFAPNVSAELDALKLLSGQVFGTNKDAVAGIIEKGLTEGLSVNDMQELLETNFAFTPTRALMIARTETTRAVNYGAVEAMRAAEVEFGIVVRKEWITAKDGEVRDEHRPLDGTQRAQGESWAVGTATAPWPGGFKQPGLDINCRCSIVPIVDEEDFKI